MYKDKFENEIKVGKRVMAYDPNNTRKYRFIGVIQSVNNSEVVIYNEKLPKNYKTYLMPYSQMLQYLREKLYK